MFSRLQADRRPGVAMCLRVREGASARLKKADESALVLFLQRHPEATYLPRRPLPASRAAGNITAKSGQNKACL